MNWTKYSITCPYRNALGTRFCSGLDRFRFRQGFFSWRGTNNANLYNRHAGYNSGCVVGRWMKPSKLI